jgi:hypothetical protein
MKRLSWVGQSLLFFEMAAESDRLWFVILRNTDQDVRGTIPSAFGLVFGLRSPVSGLRSPVSGLRSPVSEEDPVILTTTAVELQPTARAYSRRSCVSLFPHTRPARACNVE